MIKNKYFSIPDYNKIINNNNYQIVLSKIGRLDRNLSKYYKLSFKSDFNINLNMKIILKKFDGYNIHIDKPICHKLEYKCAYNCVCILLTWDENYDSNLAYEIDIQMFFD